MPSRPARDVRLPPPFDTPPLAATQGEERGVGGLRGSQTGFFNGLLSGGKKYPSLCLGLTFASARHSGESRNPFSPLSLAFRPDLLSPNRGRYGRRHIYPPHPFRIWARRSLPRVGVKCENESKNHKMDSGFRRNDGGRVCGFRRGEPVCSPVFRVLVRAIGRTRRSAPTYRTRWSRAFSTTPFALGLRFDSML